MSNNPKVWGRTPSENIVPQKGEKGKLLLTLGLKPANSSFKWKQSFEKLLKEKMPLIHQAKKLALAVDGQYRQEVSKDANSKLAFDLGELTVNWPRCSRSWMSMRRMYARNPLITAITRQRRRPSNPQSSLPKKCWSSNRFSINYF